MTAYVSVVIECKVTSERDLYRAALTALVDCGLSVRDAARELREETLDVAQCARLLLDPGLAVAGLEVEDSSAVYHELCFNVTDEG